MFKGTLSESSRVQSEPECGISWATFCNWLHVMPLLFVLILQSPHTSVQCLFLVIAFIQTQFSLMEVH